MKKGVQQQLQRLNSPELPAIVKIEASLVRGARKYFDAEGFTEVLVPHLTKATGACENVDTLFAVDFFGEQAYLTQTGQLYLESLVPALGKVYCIGPSFRAEPEADARHLCEFPLLEIEFPGDLNQLMKYIEGTIVSMVGETLANRRPELELLGVDVARLEGLSAPFKKVRYSDAVKIVGLEFGADLKAAHEAFLAHYFGDKPLFITHYPRAIKFFNMRTNSADAALVNSTDLILPFGGEAVGSAEREWEYTVLHEKLSTSSMLKQLEKRGGSIRDFEWYLEHMREHGSVPHAGCGIGLNRVTQFVLGKQDIRQCTAFPLNCETLL